MKVNPKSQKGAITLIVLVTMLFLMAFLMSLYIRISNKAQTSVETTSEIAKKYNNIDDADTIYNSYFATEDVIPIYTVEQLKKLGSGEQIEIDGKIYNFSANATYIIKNDLDLGGYDSENNIWLDEKMWSPLTEDFTGILDGFGKTIKGLYIDNDYNNQGLFGTLNGTVKNVIIEDSYITANENVGAIAGINKGKIENCYNIQPTNESNIIGTLKIGAIVGNNEGVYIGKSIDNLVNYDERLLNTQTNMLNTNVKYTENDKIAIVPMGFNISSIEEEQTIINGLVINDSNGNEFVWIPVEIKMDDTNMNIASFYRSEWIENDELGGQRGASLTNSTTYIEPYSSNSWETEEYSDMLESVYNNGGFYIGRYEAGIKTTESYRKMSTKGTSNMVVQRDCYPYIYVGWGNSMKDYESDVIFNTDTNSQTNGSNMGKGAVYLSKNMYADETKFGVKSTLCYSVQWDAMLDFIKDSNHNVINSTNWGNNYDNLWKVTRTTAKYSTDYSESWKSITTSKEKTSNSSILLTTGASDEFSAKNIYDVSGNVSEWVMETNSTTYRNFRGGSYNYRVSARPASYRWVYTSSWIMYPYVCDGTGFRPALYIRDLTK